MRTQDLETEGFDVNLVGLTLFFCKPSFLFFSANKRDKIFGVKS